MPTISFSPATVVRVPPKNFTPNAADKKIENLFDQITGGKKLNAGNLKLFMAARLKKYNPAWEAQSNISFDKFKALRNDPELGLPFASKELGFALINQYAIETSACGRTRKSGDAGLDLYCYRFIEEVKKLSATNNAEPNKDAFVKYYQERNRLGLHKPAQKREIEQRAEIELNPRWPLSLIMSPTSIPLPSQKLIWSEVYDVDDNVAPLSDSIKNCRFASLPRGYDPPW